MINSKKINWLNIIFNTEFQNAVQFQTLKEVSMVSKLVREKLNPVVFKNIGIFRNNIQFESNVFSIAIEQQLNILQFRSTLFTTATYMGVKPIEFDYHDLKVKHKGGIQDSFYDYEVALKDIKKHSKMFRLSFAGNTGYYLYPIINNFNNLTSLAINDCNIPFADFADIGIVLPNLNKLELSSVNLVKLPADIITSSDATFPPNLKSLNICNSQVANTDLLLDPYEYLFNKNSNNYSYEDFTLPMHPLPSLKRLQFCPSFRFRNNSANGELEQFLYVNPKLESLYVKSYNLKIDNSLNSLKFLGIDSKICFNSITNVCNLDSINTLNFELINFDNTENFRKLCMLCNNLVELSLIKDGLHGDPQVLIDDFITPGLPNLFKLKILKMSIYHDYRFLGIFDFTKFTQIEELVLDLLGFESFSNIKFDSCKSLKRVKICFSGDDIDDEFMETLNKYEGWIFKYEYYTLFGNKI